jgi:Queuosine biosynthesis protein
VATGSIGAQTELLIVDGIVSGMHERGTSHYELLRAFQEDDALARMAAEAEKHEYRAHEFGDAVFMERCTRVDERIMRERGIATGSRALSPGPRSYLSSLSALP